MRFNAVPSTGLWDLRKLRKFLERVWSYSSSRAMCFAMVAIAAGNVEIKHFCRGYGVERDLFMEAATYALLNAGRWARGGYHAYYQVLPLYRRPERGRGTANDVLIGKWVWTDLDYKVEVGSAVERSCREGVDYSLECYYYERNKWYYVNRPPLSEVVELSRERVGREPTIVVDSGCGYHLYYELREEVDPRTLMSALSRVVDALGGDQKTKDLARLLRLPYTVNPRNGRKAAVVYESQSKLSVDELLS